MMYTTIKNPTNVCEILNISIILTYILVYFTNLPMFELKNKCVYLIFLPIFYFI